MRALVKLHGTFTRSDETMRPSAVRPVRSLMVAIPLLLSGCAPERGSEDWCKQMAHKPKAEWNLRDAGEYAASCVIPLPGQVGSDQWCKDLRKRSPGEWSANDAKNFAMQCLLP